MLLAANLNGGNLLLEQPADIAGVLRLLIDRKVTHAVLVPTVLQRLLALPECKTADWSALSYVVYGASPIPLPVLRDATEIIGCSFLQSYGLTESTGGFTLLGPDDHVPAEEFAHRLRSAGRPMRGARVRVVDPVTLEDCPAGQRGEVLVAGSRIMKGYWRKPEQTAEIMLPGGWLRTGDGGSFDADGFLYLHDRLKDMIVTGGENVYPAEVESVMTGHPAVAEVAVVGVPSASWGESPYAVVVLRPGAEVSEADLIAWTRDRLAHFKCPVGVSFVPSLARTASGKLQKQAIRASLSSARRPLTEPAPWSRSPMSRIGGHACASSQPRTTRPRACAGRKTTCSAVWSKSPLRQGKISSRWWCGPPMSDHVRSDSCVSGPRGAVAQLVAHLHGMEGVRGSNPLSSTEK